MGNRDETIRSERRQIYPVFAHIFGDFHIIVWKDKWPNMNLCQHCQSRLWIRMHLNVIVRLLLGAQTICKFEKALPRILQAMLFQVLISESGITITKPTNFNERGNREDWRSIRLPVTKQKTYLADTLKLKLLISPPVADEDCLVEDGPIGAEEGHGVEVQLWVRLQQ